MATESSLPSPHRHNLHCCAGYTFSCFRIHGNRRGRAAAAQQNAHYAPRLSLHAQTPPTMSKSKEEALFELNMRRETWCRVEADSKFWERAERRHYDCHLQNTCDFKSLQAVCPEERSDWIGQQTLALNKHPERKHFEESSKHLKCHKR